MKIAFFLLALGAIAGCSHSRPADMPVPSSPTSGSVALRAEDIQRSPAMSIEELLVSKVAGLTLVRGVDGRLVISIRGGGYSTLSGDGEPLFVVDGVPLVSSASLAALNKFDIASVEVLKDPASTALWGVRGSNGVIVIRTRRS